MYYIPVYKALYVCEAYSMHYSQRRIICVLNNTMYLVPGGRELLLFLMKSPCLLNCVRYEAVLRYENTKFTRLGLFVEGFNKIIIHISSKLFT